MRPTEMEASNGLAALPAGGSPKAERESGRVREAKYAVSDDWSKALYLNFGFYSSIKGS